MPNLMNIDTAVMNEFFANHENTMNSVLSTSVANVLLKLFKTYFPGVSDQDIDKAFQQSLTELTTLAGDDADKKASLAYFIKLASTSHDILDKVSFYVGNKEKTYVFHLKEVFTLVWRALNDDDKFAHHDTDNTLSDEEKAQRKKQDRAFRIKSFFAQLRQISTEQPCHQGVRHALVFLLNEAYEGIHIIEDLKSTVYAFVKEGLVSAFLANYAESTNTGDKEKLMAALLAWMQNFDPQALLAITQQQKILEEGLKALFLEHGTKLEGNNLEAMQAAFSQLPFSCDPAQRPSYDLHTLFTVLPEQASSAEAALQSMQEWARRPNSIVDEGFKQTLHNFVLIYQAWQALRQSRLLLKITGNFDKFSELQTQCEAYFGAIGESPVNVCVSEDFLSNIKSLNKTLSTCQQNALEAPIENFFAHWFSARDNQDLAGLKRQYEMLCSKEFQAKLNLSDEVIERYIKENTNVEQKEVFITPYWINRIFLHAMVVQPSEWSNLFADVFQQVHQFVKDKQAPQTSVMNTLRQDSYPAALLAQLEYLSCCRTVKSTDPMPTRPAEMILLPQQVRTFDEWQRVSSLLEPEKFAREYNSLKALIDRLLLEQAPTVSAMTDCIPINGRQAFIQANLEKLVGKIKYSWDLLFILSYLPMEARLAFAQECKKSIETSSDLCSVLELLSLENRLAFALEHANKVETYKYLVIVLEQLRDEDRLVFAQECKGIIDNGRGLLSVLKKLQSKDRLAFADKCEDCIHSGVSLAYILEGLQESEQLGFAKKYKAKIRNAHDLSYVLKKFPKEKGNRLVFAKECKDILTKEVWELWEVMQTLPETEQKELKSFIEPDEQASSSETSTSNFASNPSGFFEPIGQSQDLQTSFGKGGLNEKSSLNNIP